MMNEHLTTVFRRLLAVTSLFVRFLTFEEEGLVLRVRPRWHKPRCGGCERRAAGYYRRAGRVRALVYNTVAQTGLRRNEVTLVRIQDVDFDSGVIWLPPKVAKSKREQYVRLNSDLARRLPVLRFRDAA